MEAVAEGLRKPIYGVPGSVRSARKNRAGCGPGGRSPCTVISKEFKNSKFNLAFQAAEKGGLSR